MYFKSCEGKGISCYFYIREFLKRFNKTCKSFFLSQIRQTEKDYINMFNNERAVCHEGFL